MNIEKQIFKRSKPNQNKLINYGFIKEREYYYYQTNILNNSFKIEIYINKDISIKVIDNSLNEEYTSYKIESQNGEFVTKVREEIKRVLLDIKDKCFINNSFILEQSNRITNYINKTYKDKPLFMWSKFPGYGVFKNNNTNKWYAIIMNIDKSKLDSNLKGETEIINLKLDNMVNELLKTNGFYKAYHMNKDGWISIILDDTLPDEYIESLIDVSYNNIDVSNHYIIPVNPLYFDIEHAFDNTNTIIWKQSINININDIVYLYVAKPYMKIMYKCEVIETNISYNYNGIIKINKVMKIKLLKRYNNEFTFQRLNAYGIKSIRSPRRISNDLIKDLD